MNHKFDGMGSMFIRDLEHGDRFKLELWGTYTTGKIIGSNPDKAEIYARMSDYSTGVFDELQPVEKLDG